MNASKMLAIAALLVAGCRSPLAPEPPPLPRATARAGSQAVPPHIAELRAWRTTTVLRAHVSVVPGTTAWGFQAFVNADGREDTGYGLQGFDYVLRVEAGENVLRMIAPNDPQWGPVVGTFELRRSGSVLHIAVTLGQGIFGLKPNATFGVEAYGIFGDFGDFKYVPIRPAGEAREGGRLPA